MKTFYIFTICFIAFSYRASAQKIVVDSSFANAYKKTTASNTMAAQDEEKVESFGDLVSKLGEGLWQRLKYRLNLEDVKESLEAKKEKFAGKPKEKQEDHTGS